MHKQIFGYHAVHTILSKTPKHVVELYLQSNRQDEHSQELALLADHHKIPVRYLMKDQLSTMVYHANHQGIVATVTRSSDYTEEDLKNLLATAPSELFILILDGIQDPHNLGACLRSASAAGVDAVIAPKDRACGLTPTVYKAASGAAEALPFIQVTNLVRTMQLLKAANIWIYGADEHATQEIYQTKLTGPLALALGAEGTGLRRLTRENCDLLVKIPMQGPVPNLNVSVATGICLFEAVRQRLASQGKKRS